MKEQIKGTEKIQIRDIQPITCTVQTTGNLNACRNGGVEYVHKREEKAKAKLSKVKENVLGTKSEMKETRS